MGRNYQRPKCGQRTAVSEHYKVYTKFRRRLM